MKVNQVKLRLSSLLLEKKSPITHVYCYVLVMKQKKDSQIRYLQNLLDLYEAQGKGIQLLQWALTNEVKTANIHHPIFRGESPATLLLDLFLKQVAKPFVVKMLRTYLNEIISFNIDLEVDPTRTSKSENKLNKKNLLTYTQRVFDNILNNASDCPLSLKILFHHIKRLTVNVLKSHDWHVSISAFLFLRCICPALVAPEEWDILSDPPTPIMRRGLILISKLIQSLANGVEFGMKEPYMVSFNPFIQENQQRLKKYLETVSDISNVDIKSQEDQNKTTNSMSEEDIPTYIFKELKNKDSGNDKVLLPKISSYSVKIERINEIVEEISNTLVENEESINEILSNNPQPTYQMAANNLKESIAQVKKITENKVGGRLRSQSHPAFPSASTSDEAKNLLDLKQKLWKTKTQIEALKKEKEVLLQENLELTQKLKNPKNVESIIDLKSQLLRDVKKFVLHLILSNENTPFQDSLAKIELEQQRASCEIMSYAHKQINRFVTLDDKRLGSLKNSTTILYNNDNRGLSNTKRNISLKSNNPPQVRLKRSNSDPFLKNSL